MIVGITHDEDGSSIGSEFRIGGKAVIGEKVNNIPTQLGYWKVKRLGVVTSKVAGKEVNQKDWIVDDKLQKRLCEINGSEKPTRLPIRLMDHTAAGVFNAEMQKFSTGNGVVCRSCGLGTVATETVKNGDDFIKRPREFNSPDLKDGTCPLYDCPDFKKKFCKANGYLKFYTNLGAGFDDYMYPIQFHSTSPSTIREIEESLSRIESMVKFAASVDIANGKEVPNVGLFGIQLVLTVFPVKLNGRDVYHIRVDLNKQDKERLSNSMSLAFKTNTVVNGIEMNTMQAAAMGLLGNASPMMLESPKDQIDIDERTEFFLTECDEVDPATLVEVTDVLDELSEYQG